MEDTTTVENPPTPDPVPSKAEAVKNVFRAFRTPILMVGAAIAGAVVTAKAMSESDEDEEFIDVNEVTPE